SHPRAGHILTERLRSSIQRRQRAGTALSAHLGIKVRGVTLAAERPRAVAAMLTPADTPHHLAARPLYLLDAHRAPPVRGSPQSTERSDGPAAFGAIGKQVRLVLRRVSDAVAHVWTASAEMIQREPRFTAANSFRVIAQRIAFSETPRSLASDATVYAIWPPVVARRI